MPLQVQWLASELWPATLEFLKRQGDSTAELHLFGAYPNHAVQRLHNPVSRRSAERVQSRI